MKIGLISAAEFNEFAKKHELKNIYQTSQYGELMSNIDYKVIYIGFYQQNKLVAASLILYKEISRIKYGYAPRGFIIDFYNKVLIKDFTKALKKFFLSKRFAFIKINPEVTHNQINYISKIKKRNNKTDLLIRQLKSLGYLKLKDNIYFENCLPKFTAIINFNKYNFNKVFNDVDRYKRLGLTLRKVDIKELGTVYNLIKDTDNKDLEYYANLYNIFSKFDMIDMYLADLNYNSYVRYLQTENTNIQLENEKINTLFKQNPNDENVYNVKMESDKQVNYISESFRLATSKMGAKETETVGAIIVGKYEKRIYVLASSEYKYYKDIGIRNFMYAQLIKQYKDEKFEYFDFNGITGNFTNNNPYKEMQDEILSFKPLVYEYIGEFDFIINKTLHSILWSTNKIKKEFYKKPNINR